MIPKTFSLLGYKWTVKTIDGLLNSEGEPVFGLCDFDNHKISLDSSLADTKLWHTFLHEMLHAALYSLGRNKLCDDEGFVDALSGALAQALKPEIASARPRAARKGHSKPSR